MQSNIHNILNETNGKSAFSNFYKIFKNLYDDCFNIVTKDLDKKDIEKPWINESLLKRMKIRDKLYKLSVKNYVPRKVYTDFRNILNKQINQAREKYYENEFNNNEKNIKKTWSVINSVLKPKNVKPKITISDKTTGEEINDSDVPNQFIDYFTTIAEKLTSQMPNVSTNASAYLQKRVQNSFFFAPCTSLDIFKAISNLKDNGKGLYVISTSVLESSSHIISPIIAHIINLCLKDGYFPEELKLGCITPIFKNGKKDLIENFRPVCSLSPFSKIIERIIYDKMITFITKNKIFSGSQFGFRKGMSTETAIIDYVNKIQSGLNEKQYSISVLMDLSKAFDLMDHSILKIKLEHYGFRGTALNFLMNFLNDRNYFVSVNGLQSVKKSVKIGVPQGSTLGPLLFLLYVNDMKNSSDILHFSQFADDSTVTHSHTNLKSVIKIMEREFEKVLKWLSINRLIINLKKTHLMVFTNKQRPQEISLKVNNNVITETSESKFLGVIVDNKLSWASHINYISNKISKSLSIIRYLRYSFPTKILKTLYMSLVVPYISYCNIIWGSAFNTVLNPVIILQKKCLRTITKSPFLAHTKPLFKTSKLLTIKQLFDLNCAKFMFKIFNTEQYPIYKLKLLECQVNHDYNTRNSALLRPPFERLKRFMNSFFNNGIRVWNSLSDFVKYSKKMKEFKIKMKNWLLYNS